MVTVADDFSIGARVELHGLKGAAEHNGKHGTVTGLQNERLKVRLDASGGQTLALRPANLARETAPDRDEADRLKTESTNALLKLSETLQRVGTSREAMVAAFAAESASVDDIGAGFDRALQFYGPGVAAGADAEARAHLLASKASALLMSVAGREGLPESLRVARDALGLSHEAYKLSPTKMGAFSIAKCAANVGADLGVNEVQAALDPLYDMFADSAGEPLANQKAHDRYLRSHLLSLLFRAQWKVLGKCQFAGPGEVGTMLMPVLGGPDAVELLDARESYARAGEGAARDRVAAPSVSYTHLTLPTILLV